MVPSGSRFTFANGEKYVGAFRDGKENGQGTYTFAGGNKYVGEFKDGKESAKLVRPASAGEVEQALSQID